MKQRPQNSNKTPATSDSDIEFVTLILSPRFVSTYWKARLQSVSNDSWNESDESFPVETRDETLGFFRLQDDEIKLVYKHVSKISAFTCVLCII